MRPQNTCRVAAFRRARGRGERMGHPGSIVARFSKRTVIKPVGNARVAIFRGGLRADIVGGQPFALACAHTFATLVFRRFAGLDGWLNYFRHRQCRR